MRRHRPNTRPLGRSGLAILLGALCLGLAACGGSGGSSAPPKRVTTTTPTSTTRSLTIHVTSLPAGSKSHDTPPKGRSKGDRYEFTDVLLNSVPQFGRETNERIGTDKGTMTFTGANTARLDGEAQLPDGTITFAGEVTVLDDGITVPVTGGTGTYENATGTLFVGSGADRAPNTYRLVIDRVQGPVA